MLPINEVYNGFRILQSQDKQLVQGRYLGKLVIRETGLMGKVMHTVPFTFGNAPSKEVALKAAKAWVDDHVRGVKKPTVTGKVSKEELKDIPEATIERGVKAPRPAKDVLMEMGQAKLKESAKPKKKVKAAPAPVKKKVTYEEDEEDDY